MTKTIKVGIIGAAGYTAGELLRILITHPNVEIVFAHSNSNAGKYVYQVHSDLFGDTDLKFGEADYNAVDVIYLCMGHGVSKTFMNETNLPDKVKVIDLSHDFRLNAEGNKFIYGLPELQIEKIKDASYIANPGCFATGIQLALLPLANKGLLNEEVHVNAITGSTGAGQNPSRTTHFSWRNNNVSVYKAFGHQHLGEITQSLRQLQASFSKSINFIPVRGNFSRGILSSVYTKCDLTLDEAKEMYNAFYKNHPFTFVSETNIDLKMVVNTNKCAIYLEKHDDKLLIISAIDNLIKGASGQAVHNMNIMFNLNEQTGLRLKPVGF